MYPPRKILRIITKPKKSVAKDTHSMRLSSSPRILAVSGNTAHKKKLIPVKEINA